MVVKEDTTKLLTREEQTTVRFQLMYGTGMIAVALVTFWICSQIFTVDLKYAILAIGAIVALGWLRDGLMLMADVYISIMKNREN
jgi:hypothetical protein